MKPKRGDVVRVVLRPCRLHGCDAIFTGTVEAWGSRYVVVAGARIPRLRIATWSRVVLEKSELSA